MPIDGSEGTPAQTPVAASSAAQTEAMAGGMIDTFGPRALSVAQGQADAAAVDQPTVAEIWTRIAGSIRAQSATRDRTAQ